MSDFFELTQSATPQLETKIRSELGMKEVDLLKLWNNKGLKMVIGTVNVGGFCPYYASINEIATTQRKYSQIPGTYFAIGTKKTASGGVFTQPIVYINANAIDQLGYSSCNMCTHELGHAIDDLYKSLDTSSSLAFTTLMVKYKNILFAKSYSEMVKYLSKANEFFAETFAMYLERRPFADLHHFTPFTVYNGSSGVRFFENDVNNIVPGNVTMSPHDLLDTRAKELCTYFDQIVANF